MIWKRIPKEKTSKPKHGKTYHDWKEFLAEEGFYQCVYCAIHESHFGGVRNFHVEHYKPKSIERFKELENKLENLFYACSICNCFKGSHWEEEPDPKFENCAFPDPSKVDYSELFNIDFEKGILIPKYRTSTFLVNRLFLNRPQLILERRNFNLAHELDIVIENINASQNDLFDKASKGDSEALRLLNESNIIIIEILRLLNMGNKRPYKANDIKR